jgi:hypothetical protein
MAWNYPLIIRWSSEGATPVMCGEKSICRQRTLDSKVFRTTLYKKIPIGI